MAYSAADPALDSVPPIYGDVVTELMTNSAVVVSLVTSQVAVTSEDAVISEVVVVTFVVTAAEMAFCTADFRCYVVVVVPVVWQPTSTKAVAMQLNVSELAVVAAAAALLRKHSNCARPFDGHGLRCGYVEEFLVVVAVSVDVD